MSKFLPCRRFLSTVLVLALVIAAPAAMAGPLGEGGEAGSGIFHWMGDVGAWVVTKAQALMPWLVVGPPSEMTSIYRMHGTTYDPNGCPLGIPNCTVGGGN